MFPGELGLGRVLRPQLAFNFAMTPPTGGGPGGFDTEPLPDYRRMVAERAAEDIMNRNDRAVRDLDRLNTADADYADRRREILANEHTDLLHLVQPHMPDRALATPTEASPDAQFTAQMIGNINALRHRDIAIARSTYTDPVRQAEELTNIQNNKRNEIADVLSRQMAEPVVPRPRGTRSARAPQPATPAATPAWPGQVRDTAARAADRTRDFVVTQRDNISRRDSSGRGRSFAGGIAVGAVGTFALLWILSAAGCDVIPGAAKPGTTPTPNKTPTSQTSAGPVSIASGSCLEVPADSVIMGDVNVGGHIENGHVVGGRNLYDTGDGSDQTGLVTVTTQKQTICAEWGASGQSFTTLDDAKKKAASDKADMEATGCGQNGCRRGVTIVYVP